ncbi:MAG TPA: cupin domain-containing protein [Paracoccaceae bacterium]|nr:cupin domain-containing protein [Paracoccaceae bacterium]
MQPIDPAAKLATFDEHWSPEIVGAFNGNDPMVVTVLGKFVWHHHPETDDFFMVLSGGLAIDLSEGAVMLRPGQVRVVPRGMWHRPRATVGTHLPLIEPAGTPNTGDPATTAVKVRV